MIYFILHASRQLVEVLEVDAQRLGNVSFLHLKLLDTEINECVAIISPALHRIGSSFIGLLQGLQHRRIIRPQRGNLGVQGGLLLRESVEHCELLCAIAV